MSVVEERKSQFDAKHVSCVWGKSKEDGLTRGRFQGQALVDLDD